MNIDTDLNPLCKVICKTEKDVQASGLEWVIGRNGIYIEPDLEYMDTYVNEGEIRNSAGDGKCGITSRPELGVAYTQMLLNEKHNGQVCFVGGEAITQAQLALYINQVYGTNLSFHPISIEEYKKERVTELGDFLGTVVAGIYEGIRYGSNYVPRILLGRLGGDISRMLK